MGQEVCGTWCLFFLHARNRGGNGQGIFRSGGFVISVAASEHDLVTPHPPRRSAYRGFGSSLRRVNLVPLPHNTKVFHNLWVYSPLGAPPTRSRAGSPTPSPTRPVPCQPLGLADQARVAPPGPFGRRRQPGTATPVSAAARPPLGRQARGSAADHPEPQAGVGERTRRAQGAGRLGLSPWHPAGGQRASQPNLVG